MRIGGIGGPALGPATRRASADPREPEAVKGRALIAIAASAPADRPVTTTRHPAGPFLAQLIATQMQAPQTRARRRAEPDEAIAIYAAMSAPRPGSSRRPYSKRA
jgi:hypothetical protein